MEETIGSYEAELTTYYKRIDEQEALDEEAESNRTLVDELHQGVIDHYERVIEKAQKQIDEARVESLNDHRKEIAVYDNLIRTNKIMTEQMQESREEQFADQLLEVKEQLEMYKSDAIRERKLQAAKYKSLLLKSRLELLASRKQLASDSDLNELNNEGRKIRRKRSFEGSICWATVSFLNRLNLKCFFT